MTSPADPDALHYVKLVYNDQAKALLLCRGLSIKQVSNLIRVRASSPSC